MARQLVVLVGLPGSGKTSFRKRRPQWAVVSADEVRRTVFHCDYDPAYEDAVKRIFAATLVEVVESSVAVVCVDSTNLTRAERQPLVEVARLTGREPIAHVMPVLSLDVLYARKQEELQVLSREHPEIRVNGFPRDRYEAVYRRYEDVGDDEGFTQVVREVLPVLPRREARRLRRAPAERVSDPEPLPLFVS